MSNLEIVLTILSAISMLCSIYFGYCAFARNKKQDTKQEATDFTSMKVDLLYIKDGVQDLKKDMTSLTNANNELDKRLSLLEEKLDNHISNKSIHTAFKKGN